MIIGYARVSTNDQKLERQLDQLNKSGCEKIFQEKITGTKKMRPEFIKMFDVLRFGDILIVSDLTRLSRSTKDLIEISEKLKEIGVELKSLKENIDTTTATGKLMFGMLAVLSQFERDIISERTKQGLEAARARGRKGGRKKKDSKKIEMAIELYHSKKYTLKEIKEHTGVGVTTLYSYLREGK
jgi:DNA invertase Pin-like site-specific DNA recombinase